MGPISRMLVVTAAALIVTAAPAEAGQVIVVDGTHAKRVNDPTMPSKAEIELPRSHAGGADPIASAARAAKPRADRRAVYRALKRGLASKRVSKSQYKRWRGWYVKSIRTYRKLRGARREQLGYVIDAVEGLALRDMLSPTRMPAAFSQLERNRRYWPKLPYPAPRDQVSFKGSEVVYVFFPGEGLQMHPLTTFKKANLIHGACERGEAACDKPALRKLLDEMERLAVHRTRSYWAWEYQFSFDGGTPPWISGMARPPRSRPTGARPTCWTSRTTTTSRARRCRPSRWRRRSASGPPASRAGSTTSSTRSRRSSTSSTPSSSR
jgi:hypothetical protein